MFLGAELESVPTQSSEFLVGNSGITLPSSNQSTCPAASPSPPPYLVGLPPVLAQSEPETAAPLGTNDAYTRIPQFEESTVDAIRPSARPSVQPTVCQTCTIHTIHKTRPRDRPPSRPATTNRPSLPASTSASTSNMTSHSVSAPPLPPASLCGQSVASPEPSGSVQAENVQAINVPAGKNKFVNLNDNSRCELCNVTGFASKYSHLKQYHSKHFFCVTCGLVYTRKHSLKRHVEQNHDKKQHAELESSYAKVAIDLRSVQYFQTGQGRRIQVENGRCGLCSYQLPANQKQAASHLEKCIVQIHHGTGEIDVQVLRESATTKIVRFVPPEECICFLASFHSMRNSLSSEIQKQQLKGAFKLIQKVALCSRECHLR